MSHPKLHVLPFDQVRDRVLKAKPVPILKYTERWQAPAERGNGKKKPPKVKAQATIAQTLSYPQVKKSGLATLSSEEKVLLGAAGLTGRRAVKMKGARLLASLKDLKEKSARTVIRAARGKLGKGAQRLAGRALGPIAWAGMASFAVTSAVLKRNAKTREDRARNASELAKAYRLMRLTAEQKQGYPLDHLQLRAAAEAFKTELAKHGFQTDNLKKL